MKATISKDKKTLTLELPLEKPSPSASGKTMVVFSTRGNQKLGVQVEGKDLVAGINVYFKP